MAINSSQLANLIAIANAGSFTKAAEERGMSQPALSNSIALLEQRLGVRVLDRSTSGSVLTRYGEILVRRGLGLNAFLEDAEREVRLSTLGRLGPLRIAATPSVLSRLLPEAITSLTSEVGDVHIEIVDALDEALKVMLQSGGVDIIVGPLSGLFPVEANVLETPLISDPLVLAIGPYNPLRGSRGVSLRDLGDKAWALPREGSDFRALLEALFRSSSVKWPGNCVLTNSLAVIEELVAETDRVSIVTPIQLSSLTRLELVPLQEATSRVIGIKTRRDVQLTELGALFIRHIKRVASSFAGRL